MQGQIDFNEYLLENGSPYERPLFTIHNGKTVSMSYSDIFDSDKYDTIKCETYVSSVGFIMQALKRFKKAQIIVGIGKDDVTSAFAESVRRKFLNEGTKYFIKLKNSDKDKIINNEFEFKYPKADAVIHDKLYLLSDSVTGEKRVVYGSVNLTKRAFSNKINQYEIAVIEDNTSLYDEFLKRFYAVYNLCEDYIPKTIQEKYINNEPLIYQLSTEEQVDDIVRKIKEEGGKLALSEELMEEIKDVVSEDENINSEVNAVFEIVNLSTKRKKGTSQLLIKSDEELVKAKKKIRNIVVQQTKNEKESGRFCLKYDTVAKMQYHVFSESNAEDGVKPPEVYSRQASDSEITAGINNIMDMIAGYCKYTMSPEKSEEYSRKILEAIMYGFTAPYIFKLRQETIRNKEDIPIIMVLGGHSFCGKSKLLAYISTLLSGVQAEQDKLYFDYIKDCKGNFIESLMRSDNTFPVLVDEVNSSRFFASKSGEALVKSLANTLSHEHPAMICTTNASEFAVPQQVARRIYYLQIDSNFNKELQADSSDYYDGVIGNASNLLFRDFCFRLDRKIKENDSLFDEKEIDFLYLARTIFKKYFAIAGLNVPSYFPETLLRDYEEQGRNLWKDLFREEPDAFHYNKFGRDGSSTLSINFETVSNKLKKQDTYLGYLRQDILVDDRGLHIILNANKFFIWIDEKNPFAKKSLIEKIRGQ